MALLIFAMPLAEIIEVSKEFSRDRIHESSGFVSGSVASVSGWNRGESFLN